MGKATLRDDAMLGQILDVMYGLLRRIDATIRAGNLPEHVMAALVDSKLSLIEITRRYQAALETEPEE